MDIGASRGQQIIRQEWTGKQAKVKASVPIPRYRSSRVLHPNPANPPV